MIEILKNTKIDFMGKRNYAFILSGALFLLGMAAIVQIALGRANLGVDFSGGTAVQIKFAQHVSLSEIRKTLDEGGLKDFDLQDLPAENKILIRVKKEEAKLGGFSEKIIEALSKRFSDKTPVIDSTTEIGPKVGARLRKDALWAILMATAGLLMYVGWRFRFIFGIGATIAALHDVLAVVGLLYIMGREFNLIIVSALLAIAGYSLTDTVVVFDRIRENMKVRHKEPLETVMNASINEVLPRTVITSLTTIFAALALFIFGGEVIHDFALAMIMGIIIGTYSTMFIANPIVLLWGRKKTFARRP
ncbi:MAG: protein translocase subunit SecF [Thermodesulfovibrionales bacterium]|nr:protein translocase subunit SecF [Thermodesulfovibrionales bacterium]